MSATPQPPLDLDASTRSGGDRPRPASRRCGGRSRDPPLGDARDDVRRRDAAGPDLGRLPPRALPRGEAPASRREPLPGARRRGRRRELRLATGRGVPRVTAHRSPSRRRGHRHGRDRARVLRPGPLARRSARLACVRCGRALAGVRRGDARLASHAGDRRPARGRLAVERLEGRSWSPGGTCRRDQVLRLAARRLARCDAKMARQRSRAADRGRVATPRAAVHLAARLRARALTCRRGLRPRQLQRLRTARSGRGERRRRSGRVRGGRRRSPRRRLAIPELRTRGRSCARALPDRLARLLRARRAAARRRASAAVRDLVPPSPDLGARRAPGWVSATYRRLSACFSSSQSCSESPSGRSGAATAPRRRPRDRDDPARARALRARRGPVGGARHRPRDLRRPGQVGARLPRGDLPPGRGDRPWQRSVSGSCCGDHRHRQRDLADRGRASGSPVDGRLARRGRLDRDLLRARLSRRRVVDCSAFATGVSTA